ncbi:hypothetical protein D3C80_752170 [compost metagenome]
MSDDVFDLDDRIIDQDAGHQRDGEQAEDVERKAEYVDGKECRDDRQRQCDSRNQRRAPIAQEEEHDDDRKCRPFEQGIDRRMIISFRV